MYYGMGCICWPTWDFEGGAQCSPSQPQRASPSALCKQLPSFPTELRLATSVPSVAATLQWRIAQIQQASLARGQRTKWWERWVAERRINIISRGLEYHLAVRSTGWTAMFRQACFCNCANPSPNACTLSGRLGSHGTLKAHQARSQQLCNWWAAWTAESGRASAASATRVREHGQAQWACLPVLVCL